jgi:hypothetical protein
VRKRFLPITLVSSFLIFLINFSCTKLDTTTLGSDLIPVVDNINTFADTLDIDAFQGYFNDTTKVNNSEAHALGNISNDPLFGTTRASVYLQFKPAFFPFYLGNATDTIVGIDSMFVTLSYLGAYGDSVTPQQIQVQQILDSNFKNNPADLRSVQYAPAMLGPVLGSTTVVMQDLKNQVRFGYKKDSVVNQIRIPITNQAFINSFTDFDSTLNNPYHDTATFRNFFNGFAITPAGNSGNGLIYVSVSDTKTRIEVHYRSRNKNVFDTSFATFHLLSTDRSTSSNGIIRNYSGFPVASPGNDNVYLQTSPGTYANLKIDSLGKLSNRIIHRAEIVMEQVPGDAISDSLFEAPSYLYLDLLDSTSGNPKWKTIYFDLNPATPYDPDFKTGYPFFPAAGVDPTYFGGTRKFKKDASGKSVVYYDFNVTRYVQQLVTKAKPNYTLRVFPAFNFSYPQYSKTIYSYYNNIANGRVRLATQTNPDLRKRPKMIIIWSKIK